ncbi:acyl-CoA dehydrogenase family protein [Nitriliruptor alkaliphilus]|uniref:acyl-CoA dehydrogenase family protein n=1 Tax=Nitriliruptor alkaliphilus TaxID=427918 RepID=UPI001B8074DA|nr:acyl-CoA dehydrogenase family protein [Nitriliruptor alkaliphilus]
MAVPRFLNAVYEAGLAWVHHPAELGGLGLPRNLQVVADRVLREAGGADPFELNPIGYGMAAPTLVAHAPAPLSQALLRPLFTGEHIWCQLFSEPGAGSDLAGLATMARRDGGDWVVDGEKLWTSLAHLASYALLLARTDPDRPKHQGLTCFVLDMTSPGVEVRPLRQMTGQTEFNQVVLHGVRVPDGHRVGATGDGWRVAMTTLMNERSAIGDGAGSRGNRAIDDAVELWARFPHRRTPALRDRLAALWTRAEAQRFTSERMARSATSDHPGPEGSIGKLVTAELNQAIYLFCTELLGCDGVLYDAYQARDSDDSSVQQRFLRAQANTIEGGTSDILRNIVGERLLGLPGEPRIDTHRPWREIPRG